MDNMSEDDPVAAAYQAGYRAGVEAERERCRAFVEGAAKIAATMGMSAESLGRSILAAFRAPADGGKEEP